MISEISNTPASLQTQAPWRSAGGPELAEQLFGKIDADGDGALSTQELGAIDDRLAQAASAIDGDGDGLLTSSELSAFAAQHAGHGAPRPNPESLFAALTQNHDSDGDGLLSQQELAGSRLSDLLSPQFSSIDADADGLISQSELEAFRPEGLSPFGALRPEEGDASALLETLEGLLTDGEEDTEEEDAVLSDADLVQQFENLLAAIR